MLRPLRLLASETPVAARSLGLLVACAGALSGSAAAVSAQALTEAEVIRIARSQAVEVQAARAATKVAEAEELRAGLYPNPELAWEREHSLGRAADRERVDSIFLTIPIELTGRRSAEQALARSGASAAKAQAARTQSQSVAAALGVFHEALAAERAVQIASEALARLDEAVRVVGRRYEEGTTSGYERTRIELEAELARSQLRQARGRVAIARTTLAARLGLDAATIALRGDLATGDPEAEPATKGQRRSVLWLEAAEREAHDARSAAQWAWVPTLSLSGGLRIAERTDAQYGYVAGLSLTLPVFSRGQDLLAESSARKGLAAAEVALAERVSRIEVVRAREQLVAAREEIARFTAATADRLTLLERAVQSGYGEGDRTVVELLDAQRARTEVEARRLQLELQAKQAETDLRSARGEFE